MKKMLIYFMILGIGLISSCTGEDTLADVNSDTVVNFIDFFIVSRNIGVLPKGNNKTTNDEKNKSRQF